MAVKKGLGRGLDVLIPKDNKNNLSGADENKSGKTAGSKKSKANKENIDANQAENINAAEDDKKNIITLDINKIEPNRNQPRKQFDEEAIEELSDSIKKYGLIQPLIVQNKGDYYEIIAGERRWRACKAANLTEVPVIVKDFDESDVLKVSLIENLQRENLNPIEEAQAYQVLKKTYGLKQDEIAASVSKSRVAITNTMRLLKLDERIQNLILENQISSGHGRALLAIEDKEIQYKAALKIRDDNLSVREAERLVKRLLSKLEEDDKDQENKDEENARNDEIRVYEEQLKEIIGSKVVIKNNKNNKGKIEIDYYSLEEFERIMEFLHK